MQFADLRSSRLVHAPTTNRSKHLNTVYFLAKSQAHRWCGEPLHQFMLGVFVLGGPVPQGKGDADKPLRGQWVAAPDHFFGHLGHERRCGPGASVAVGAKASDHQLSERLTSHEVERDDDGRPDALGSLQPGYGLPYRADYPLGKRKDETFEDLCFP